MKKVWFFVVYFLMLMPLAYKAAAYIEIDDKNDAKATSGEQTTNLYRLNLRGMSAVKKLKKVDEIITRDEASGKKIKVYDISELLENDATEKEKEEQKKLLKEVNTIVAAPKKLRVAAGTDVYNQLMEMRPDTRDSALALQLINNLRGRY